MRYYTYGVGAQLVMELEIAGAVGKIIHDGADIIHLDLITGESLMIHLIDSAIPVYEIRHLIRGNTQGGHHTLFILWADMLLPDHGSRMRIEDWHEAFLSIYGGRIYAYKIYMEQLYVFPVEFHTMNYSFERVTHYGAPLDVGRLHCSTVETTLRQLHGTWRIATFDGDPDAYYRQRAEAIGRQLPVLLQNAYTLLEIQPGVDRLTVKTAYRELARRFHPDLNTNLTDAHEKMQELNQAYAAIMRALDAQ